MTTDALLALAGALRRVADAGVPLQRTAEEEERKRRIDVAAWAYAYEIDADPLVDDATYDRVAREIRPEMSTSHDALDQFFRSEFDPDTGVWVHQHPEREKLRVLVARRRRYREAQNP